jgi:hypothetical protein
MLLCGSAGGNSRKAYICSPCRSDISLGIQRNIKAARVYMFYAYIYLSVVPKATHAYLPLLLNDSNEDERKIALQFGSRLLESCDKLLVCGDKITGGMKNEILEAFDLGLTIRVFHRHTYEAVCALMPETSDKCQLVYDENHLHFALSFNAEALAPFWEEAHNSKL